MMNRNRREFLADVGQGMLVASVGPALAADLGLAPAFAGDGPRTPDVRRPRAAGRADAGDARRQAAAARWSRSCKDGTDLRDAGRGRRAWPTPAPSAARTTIGYHTFMALAPGLPDGRASCPRTAGRCRCSRCSTATPTASRTFGGRTKRGAAPGRAGRPAQGHAPAARLLREATRKRDIDAAERTFAALAKGPLGEAYNHLQFTVQDEVDVHRVVLAWRAWAMLDLTGKEHAHTLLRQSVRFCVRRRGEPQAERAGDPHRAAEAARPVQAARASRPATRKADDAWVEQLARRSTAAVATAGRRGRRRRPGRGHVAGGHRRGDLAGRQPAGAARPRPPQEPGAAAASRWAASTAPRSASTPPTRPTPGGTSPASATRATPSPA